MYPDVVEPNEKQVRWRLRLAYIDLPRDTPGILGPIRAYPDTGRHLLALAESLLRGPSSLSPAEREIIATLVSSNNDCGFCRDSHAAAARNLPGASKVIVEAVLSDYLTAPITEKLRVLLSVAEDVRRYGRISDKSLMGVARRHGADDRAIHDAVLISAAFCMYNRYVSGLDAPGAGSQNEYDLIGRRLASTGYINRE